MLYFYFECLKWSYSETFLIRLDLPFFATTQGFIQEFKKRAKQSVAPICTYQETVHITNAGIHLWKNSIEHLFDATVITFLLFIIPVLIL